MVEEEIGGLLATGEQGVPQGRGDMKALGYQPVRLLKAHPPRGT